MEISDTATEGLGGAGENVVVGKEAARNKVEVVAQAAGGKVVVGKEAADGRMMV